MKRRPWVSGTAAAVLACLFWRAGGFVKTANGEEPSYEATCQIMSLSVVKGLVSNQSKTETYAVNGMVTFSFYRSGAPIDSNVTVPGSGVIVPGAAVVVAQASLPFVLGNDEECRLSVTGAIKKISPAEVLR